MIALKLAYFKKNHGFSMVEILFTLALISLFMASFFSVFFNIQKRFFTEKKRAEGLTEQQQTHLLLFKDLINTQTSFGVLNFSDDNGNNFFDIYTDYPSKLLTTTERAVTFSVSSAVTDQYIAFLHSKEETLLRVNAANLFLHNSTAVDAARLKKEIDKNGWWSENNLILFYVPSYLRPLNDALTEAPQLFFFIGELGTSNMTAANIKNFTGDGSNGFKNPFPSGDCLQRLDTFQDFIQCMPLFGGYQDIVFARKVSLLVYRFKKVTENGQTVGKLYRCIGDGTKKAVVENCGDANFPGQFIMDIKELSFKRADISKGNVSVSITPF